MHDHLILFPVVLAPAATTSKHIFLARTLPDKKYFLQTEFRAHVGRKVFPHLILCTVKF